MAASATKVIRKARHSRPIAVLVSAILVLLGSIMPTPAHAATIDFGIIKGAVGSQQAYTSVSYNGDGTATFTNQVDGGCLKYGTMDQNGTITGTDASGTLVTHPDAALGAHGYNSSTCFPDLAPRPNRQSAVKVEPADVSSVQDGQVFLLGKVSHINRPISGAYPQYYQGNLQVQFPGFDAPNQVTFDWQLAETSNQPGPGVACERSPSEANPQSNGTGINVNGCADWISFRSRVPTTTLHKDGITYQLIVAGFTQNAECSALDPSGIQQTFWTTENDVTSACLYASFQQVRSLKIHKHVQDAPPGVVVPPHDFAFSSTSVLDGNQLVGSPWDNANWTLSDGQTYAAQNLLQNEEVTITEQQDPKWTTTGISCTDGDGHSVPVTTDLANGRMTISAGAPPTLSAAPISCTIENTYHPDGKLTLRKELENAPAGVDASAWTLSATSGSTTISGATGTPGVSGQVVPLGSYTLAETGPAGYAGTWACVDVQGAPVAVTNNQVEIADNADITCTATNRYQTGSLQITKAVSGPEGGFISTGQVFTGTYACGTITGNFALAKGETTTVDNIPAGTSCTVTETAPSGSDNLANGSYQWTTPSYAPAQTVAITDNGVAAVTITNNYVQQAGNLDIAKVITPRENVAATGYTGGDDREFPVHYDCTLGGQSVSSGDVNISRSTPGHITGIPATAVCTVTEAAVSAAPGDFVDASYAWDGSQISDPVTIAADGTAQATVTNYFTKVQAGLTITKQVTGEGYTGGTAENFTVTVDCGTHHGSQQVTLADGASKTIQVPAGVACSITEETPTGNLDAAHKWGTPSYTGLTNGAVTVPADGSATVTVTNSTVPIYGSISVTKAVTGETAGLVAGSTFPVTVTCGTTTTNLDLVVGTAQTVNQIPVGSSCTITEGAALPGLVDASYAWGATPAAQTVTIDQEDQVVPVIVTNTIDRVYGSLAITKVVTPLNGVDGAAVNFTGTWSCQYGDAQPVTGTWSVTGSFPATLTGDSDQIPLTSTCSITEDAVATPPSNVDTSYIWGAPTITGPTQVTAAAPQASFTVTNPVERTTGAFAVTKTVNGGTAGTAFADLPFGFTFTCTPLSGDPVTGNLEAKAGETATLPDTVQVPTGSTCELTEDTSPAAINPYTWDSVSYQVGTAAATSDKATFTVTDQPTTVMVTNTITPKTTTVTIAKKVTGETAGLVAGTQFSVNVQCTEPGKTDPTTFGPVTVSDQGNTTVEVPLGSTNCSAIEAAPTGGLVDGSYAWGTPTYAPASVAQVGVNGATITVSNPITRVYSGNLTITKVVNDPGSVVANDFSYSGTWACRYGTDAPVTGTWSATGAGPATVEGIPASGLLIGSACTLTENALDAPSVDPSYSWKAAEFTEAVVAENGAALTVTNTVQRNTGSFTIAKEITGETGGYGPLRGAFTVDYSCRYDPNGPEVTGTVSLNPGGSVTVDGIPLGWTCSAAERPIPGDLLADESYVWGTPVVSAPVTITAGAVPTITVSNPIGRQYGQLAITKAIGANADAVADDASFSGTWTCEYEGIDDAVTAGGTWTVTGKGGPAVLTATSGDPAQILATSICNVTENAPAGGLIDQSWTWTPPTIGDDVTIGVNQIASITLTNTPERVYGSMNVVKVFDGDAAAALKPGVNVTGTWTCTVPGGSRPEDNQNGVWAAPAAGGTVTLFTADGDVKVPLGAQCTVLEDVPGADLLTDESYTWNTAQYAPGGGQAVVGTDEAVTITNSVRRVEGPVTVTKVIDIPSPATLLTGYSGTFTGTYTCTHVGDPDKTGTWTINYDQADPASQSTTVDGVLMGSSCTFTETPLTSVASTVDPSYVFDGTATFDTNPVQMAPGAAIQVTNHTTRVLTDLQITKELTGLDAGDPGDGLSFDISYDCLDRSGVSHTGTSTLTAGQTWTTDKVIPVGSTCTVTEGPRPEVGPRYIWLPVGFTVTHGDAVVIDPANSRVTFEVPLPGADGAQVSASVVVVGNVLERQEAGYFVTKTADPASGSTVQPGDTITYTVTVTPTGPGVVDNVVVSDDLGQVLPFANVTVGTASQGTASISGNTLTWMLGTISGNQPLTLTYSAQVKAGAWGVTIGNSITATGEEPPSDCPTCQTTTEHQTPVIWTLSKTSDPASGSKVKPGQVITYQLTLTNPSARDAVGVGVSDDLSQVLNHASLVAISTSPAPSLVGTTLTWTGITIPANGQVVLTYQVKVNDEAWGATLTNVVTGDPGNPPHECPECPTTTTHRVPPKGLPVTGLEGAIPSAMGVSALAGLAVLVVRRRRRSE